jgi:RimJ/RimL family protein N-acetyltransferase
MAETITERLLLRPWSDTYLDDLARIFANPLVMRYISSGRPLDREIVAKISQHGQKLWEVHGYGPWAAIERQSGRWVGRIGLNRLDNWPDEHKWEVG